MASPAAVRIGADDPGVGDPSGSTRSSITILHVAIVVLVTSVVLLAEIRTSSR